VFLTYACQGLGIFGKTASAIAWASMQKFVSNTVVHSHAARHFFHISADLFTQGEEIATTAKGPLVVVTKSTVPLGTNRQVKQVMRKANPALDFDVASNPEFLREGAAIDDFMKPDRVVIGVQTDRAAEVMKDIYRPL